MNKQWAKPSQIIREFWQTLTQTLAKPSILCESLDKLLNSSGFSIERKKEKELHTSIVKIIMKSLI